MKNNHLLKLALSLLPGFLVPSMAFCQTTLPGDVQQLHTVLENVYDQMLPLCAQLTTIARAIGSFGATFYIGYRVWKHIANAEPIDFFPLFRPFVLAILIGMFPKVMGLINAILKPSVTGTAAIVTNSNNAVQGLLEAREAVIKNSTEWKVLVGPTGEGDRAGWYKYTHPNSSGEGFLESIPNDMQFFISKMIYSIKNWFKYLISIVLELLYYAASLAIDTIRTFHMVVLSVLGPFVFGLACYDGMQQSLIQWLGRYINIYMWLPVANLFGAILNTIQQNMLKIDIAQIQANGTTSFTSTDLAYLIFMIIGIAGYFTVPSVANYIVHTHGPNALLSKVNNFSRSLFSSSNSSSSMSSSQYGPAPTGGKSGNSSSNNFMSNKIK